MWMRCIQQPACVACLPYVKRDNTSSNPVIRCRASRRARKQLAAWVATRCLESEQHPHRLFEELTNVLEQLRAGGAVDRAMVGGERAGHHLARRHLAVPPDGPRLD